MFESLLDNECCEATYDSVDEALHAIPLHCDIPTLQEAMLAEVSLAYDDGGDDLIDISMDEASKILLCGGQVEACVTTTNSKGHPTAVFFVRIRRDA